MVKIGIARANLLRMINEALDPSYYDYAGIVEKIAKIFPKSLVASLTQIVNGPTSDHDIISADNRNKLLELGIAIRVCCNGQQGYTASKYLGYSILRAINDNKIMKANKENKV